MRRIDILSEISFFKRIEPHLFRPIIENLPFFITFTLLFSPHVAKGFLNDLSVHFTGISFVDSFYVFLFNICEILTLAYLCCLVLSYTRSSIIKVFLYIFILFLFGVNLYLRIFFGTYFSANTMLLMLETNKSETLEFFETFAVQPMSIAFIVFLPLIGVLLFFVEKHCRKKRIKLKTKVVRISFFCSIIFVLSIGAIETMTYVNSFRNQTFSSYEKLLSESLKYIRIDYFRRMVSSIFFLHLMSSESKAAIAITEKVMSENIAKAENDSLIVVVVIGESFIKSHASIYGYSLKTMPYLEEQKKKGNLTIYNNAITTANHTSISLRNFFSCNSVGNGERWSEAPFFPAIFKVAGYKVFYWDNQYDKYVSSDFDFALNAYIHHSFITRFVYDMSNEQKFRYDGQLVADFRQSCLSYINQYNGNSLVLFHLMGQHFKTDQRYPHVSDFCRYNADSIRREANYLTAYKKQLIASYDNAILYNDAVLKYIIQLFKDKNAVILFFSDHGELVYDVSDVIGRTMTIGQMSAEEMAHYYEIPMVFWFSDRYKEKYPEMINALEKSRNQRLMSDNICQILFHIGRIKSKWYRPNRDVMSSDYQCVPRFIDDAVDYDKVK